MKKLITLVIVITILVCTSFLSAQNLYTDANAGSFENESNSVSGWIFSNTILTSSNLEAEHGNYSLRLETGSTTERSADYYFTAVIGEEYTIKIWAKQGAQSNDPAFAGWTGLSGFSTTVIGTTLWTEYTWTVTATVTNPMIKFFSGSLNGGAIGDAVYIDNISIVSSSSPSLATNYGIGSGGQGSYNTFLGAYAGTVNTGAKNTFIGSEVGKNSTVGSENTFLGHNAGYLNIVGNGNLFLGHKAGYNETGSNKLYLDNSDTATPLLYGNFSTNQLGINTNSIPTGYAFAVKGKMIAEEIKVQISPWADFVFEEDYKLPTLAEVEKHIKENGHLEHIPSAKEVEKNGISLGQMDAKLLQKIEELTLYTIQQEKELKKQEQENKALKLRLDKMEQLLNKKDD